MNNTAIAKQLVKLAKQLIAGKPNQRIVKRVQKQIKAIAKRYESKAKPEPMQTSPGVGEIGISRSGDIRYTEDRKNKFGTKLTAAIVVGSVVDKSVHRKIATAVSKLERLSDDETGVYFYETKGSNYSVYGVTVVPKA